MAGVTLFIAHRRVDVRPGAPAQVIGRDAACDAAFIADQRMSARHARVWADDAGAWIEDLASTNGTYVNGARITGPHALNGGDRLHLGGQTAKVQPGTLPKLRLGFREVALAALVFSAAVIGLGFWRQPTPISALEMEYGPQPATNADGIAAPAATWLSQNMSAPRSVEPVWMTRVLPANGGGWRQRVRFRAQGPVGSTRLYDLTFWMNDQAVARVESNPLP